MHQIGSLPTPHCSPNWCPHPHPTPIILIPRAAGAPVQTTMWRSHQIHADKHRNQLRQGLISSLPPLVPSPWPGRWTSTPPMLSSGFPEPPPCPATALPSPAAAPLPDRLSLCTLCLFCALTICAVCLCLCCCCLLLT